MFTARQCTDETFPIIILDTTTPILKIDELDFGPGLLDKTKKWALASKSFPVTDMDLVCARLR